MGRDLRGIEATTPTPSARHKRQTRAGTRCAVAAAPATRTTRRRSSSPASDSRIARATDSREHWRITLPGPIVQDKAEGRTTAIEQSRNGSLRLLKRLIEVPQDIGQRFEPNGKSNHF